MIPLGIVSAAGSSLVPLVSSISFSISGSYGTVSSSFSSGYSSSGSSNFTTVQTDVDQVGPMTITATLTGIPESGPGELQPLSGKTLTFTYGINEVYFIPVNIVTDANGEAVFTIQSFGSGNSNGWSVPITIGFAGENAEQIIISSSRTRTATFRGSGSGGAA
jgi:hypothetical protein